ncbi:MBL fold metallo-hydrolase [Actinomyces sp. B33]|uniref:MBL fold metallo-hydrolase n=1 Tax=Actinomyces sp. B33 TaxID=2942131 RepID=UPI0023425EC2|nr:MBL fold metallo-hydrolase [Actinomyces sp. B33]MDC4233153.1 MBL fold metallo-hydrolase [Actinomyces sp. B33]
MRVVQPRHQSTAFLVVGGPTVVIDVAGLRLVTDPTFDGPGDYGALLKTEGPAIDPAEVADADAVLVSHADHADNLDASGRDFALAAPLIVTNPGSARALGGAARGLSPWEGVDVGRGVRVTAVPATHGPADGELDARGWVNCEVTGFVIEAGRERIYVSGDNTSMAHVGRIRDRFGSFDHAVVHAGRATVPGKFSGRPLSLSSERASAAAQLLEAPHVVVVHQTGWAHFVDGPGATIRAFRDAGILNVLDMAPHGRWSSAAR